MSGVQIFLWYLIFSLFVAGLLMTNLAINDAIYENYDYSTTFLDSWFLATSALTNTGLYNIDYPLYMYYDAFGEAILYMTMFVGAIGWISIKLFFLMFILRKVITYRDEKKSDENLVNSKVGNTKGMILMAVFVLIFGTLIFGPIFSAFFYTVEIDSNWINSLDGLLWNEPETYAQAFWLGMFTATSAIANAGIQTVSNYSLAPYYYNIGFQIMVAFLIIMGAIGFQVLYDVKEWIKVRKIGEKFRFSLTTKVAASAYFIILLISLVIIYLLELVMFRDASVFMQDTAYGTDASKAWALTFNTISARSAGLSTMDISTYSDATLIALTLLMFIGGGPASVAGGIRTTTLMLLFVIVWSYVRGKKEATLFRRTISKGQVYEGISITISAILLFIITSLIVSTSLIGTEDYSMLDIIFETSSAIGTCGHSTGVTSDLNSISMIALIITMFIGQLGFGTTLRILRPKHGKVISYVEESIVLS